MEVKLAQIQIDKFLCSKESQKYGLSPSEVLFLLSLANRIGKSDDCWPSQEFLSSYTGMSERNIRRVTASLCAKNLIKSNKNWKSIHYELCIPSPDTMSAENEVITGHHVRSEVLSPDTMSADHRTPCPPNISMNNSLKANNSFSFTDVNTSEIFEQFWEAYPRKQNKTKAKKVWKNRKLDKQIDLILEDIAKRKLHDHQWKEKQYTPLATTYLNGERWEDEIITEQLKEQPKQTGGYQRQETKSTVQFWEPDVVVEPEIQKTEEEKRIIKEEANQAWVEMRKKLNLTRK